MRADSFPTSGWNVESLEQALFSDAILRGCNGGNGRGDPCARFRESVQRVKGHVLPVDGGNFRAASKLAEQLAVGEGALQDRGDAVGGSAFGGVQE